MLCCTALQHRRSTSSSECCTTRIGSYSSHQEDPTPNHSFADRTGCRSSRKSSTRQQCSHSRFGSPQHQPTSAVTYRHATVRGIFDHLAPRCCHELPPGLTSLCVVSITRHLLSATHCLRQSSIFHH